ncbi:hypothetical protein BJX70DRAFT_407641 [Aspergillus crustosus]
MESPPDDILVLIADCLEDHDDRYNAIFVNRQFHATFSGSLYRSVTLNNRSQIQSFTKTLILHPHLIPVVHSLAIEDRRHGSEKPTLTHDDLAMFSLQASQISQSAGEHLQWEQDLCLGKGEAWTALLLSIVTNLRFLKLRCHTFSQYLETLFTRATTQQKPFDTRPAFHRLEELSLALVDGKDEEKQSFSNSQIRPFLRLLRLQRLSIDSFVEYLPPSDQGDNDDSDSNDDPSKPSISPISDLILTSSNAPDGTSTLLTSCPSLKTFKYQHSDDHAPATTGFQPRAFSQTLSPHKSTLETLHLDNFGTHHAFTASGLNESCDDRFGSLADFTALRELRIRVRNLLDVPYTLEPTVSLAEVLPVQIESLFIEDCRENLFGMLVRQLAGLLEARFGALRRIDVEGFFHVDDEDLDASGVDGSAGRCARVIKPAVYDAVQTVEEACAEAGIQFVLRDRMCVQTLSEG